MMATAVWQRIREGIGATPAAQDESMRRVAIRLAAQTVMLLLVMLIALEIVVYFIVEGASIESLKTTLQDRANRPDPTICALDPRCSGDGFQSRGHSRFPRRGPPASPSEASAVYINLEFQAVHGDGPLGTSVLDWPSVRRAMFTGEEHCCSVDTYEGQHYLVYTKPLEVNVSGPPIGAVQTSISEQVHERTMRTLVQRLLLVALLGLLVSGGISTILVSRALQPIRTAMQRQRDFVADAAHELRTPLAIMRTVGEVGMADSSTDELQATIEQMLGENHHLTRLVEDLSLLARTDTNAVSIERRPVDLSALVLETAAELRPLAEAQGVTLDTDVGGSVWALGDILRLRQLLLILLDNALKHTPSGGTVAIHLSSRGGRARLQVSDSGPGIPPADLSRIFERFYRSDQSRTGEGSGLGLAIGKWIAEAHGGHIQAANAAPHGAIFTATLPLARTAAAS